jgi:hypothetical protein
MMKRGIHFVWTSVDIRSNIGSNTVPSAIMILVVPCLSKSLHECLLLGLLDDVTLY